MQDFKISLATIDDLDSLMDLSKEFQAIAPEQHTWDEDKCRGVIINSFDNEDQVIITLKFKGKIVGMLFGMVTEPFLSHKRMAVELAWFVSKENRGHGSLDMVNIFEQWAEYKGANSVVMADITEVGSLEHVYKKLGYSKLESSYNKEL